MRGRLLGMLLPVALGYSVLLARGYAGNEPPVVMDPAMPVPVIHPGPSAPGVNYPPTPMPNLVPYLVPPAPAEREPESAVHAWLREHRLCCWSHHDSPGCGSFQAEYHYIFGSCRKFFGEPCLPKPAPYPPVAPGYGGYGQPARTGCGCNW